MTPHRGPYPSDLHEAQRTSSGVVGPPTGRKAILTRTGLTQTRVVERAMSELLASLEAEAAASRLNQLLDRVHTELTASGGPLDFDALYDPKTGLPR